MKWIADFDIISEICLPNDNRKFKLQHPDGHFEIHISNARRREGERRDILSVQLLFELSDLSMAKEIALTRLMEALNTLTFVTNAAFYYHRLIKLVEWEDGQQERQSLIFTELDPCHNPQPVLDEAFIFSTQVLLGVQTAPAIQRALRWFRLGVVAKDLEEQFQYFWLALEIVAEHGKDVGKVFDQCPKCRNRLYCEACDEHPTHRPYPKHAIRQVVSAVLQNQSDEVFSCLYRARNTLMHGGCLEDIENDISVSGEHLVDLLGKVTWYGLLRAFPREALPTELTIGQPATYVRRELAAAVHVTVRMPESSDGSPNIDNFPDIQVTIVSDPGPSTPPAGTPNH